MSVEYRAVTRGDYEDMRLFLSGAGWGHRVQDADRFEKMMDATDRAVLATENGQIVGFARALCDDVSNGYLSMVAVAPKMRGLGIGRALVEWIIGDDPQITWVLRAGRGSTGFWRKMGFIASETTMERPRSSKSDVAVEDQARGEVGGEP